MVALKMDIEKIVKDIIAYHSGYLVENLHDDMMIEDDLGITGDDAWELLEILQKKFDVDFSEFDFLLHFGPEAGLHVDDEYGYYPISIKHIIDVAKARAWRMPPRNSDNYLRIQNQRKAQRRLFWGLGIALSAWLVLAMSHY